MSRRRQEGLILAGVILLALMGLVAFVKVVLSALVAAFIAGLGAGAFGVIALRRPAARESD